MSSTATSSYNFKKIAVVPTAKDFIDVILHMVLGQRCLVDDGLGVQFHDDLSLCDLQFEQIGFIFGDDRPLEDLEALERSEFHLFLPQ